MFCKISERNLLWHVSLLVVILVLIYKFTSIYPFNHTTHSFLLIKSVYDKAFVHLITRSHPLYLPYLRVLYSKFKIKKGSLDNKRIWKLKNRGFSLKALIIWTILLLVTWCKPIQNKIPARTFGSIMALIFITIRIDNICFDDGSQQSFFLPNKKLSAPMKKKISLICLQSKYMSM